MYGDAAALASDVPMLPWHYPGMLRPIPSVACAALALLGMPLAFAAAVRAEVQIGVCSPLPDVVAALKLQPSGPPTITWLFDDHATSLHQRGLRLRLRIEAKGADLTLKVAKQDCAKLPPDAIPAGQGKCEIDLHGASIYGAVSIVQPLPRERADALANGTMKVQDAMSPAQWRYLRDVVRAAPLPDALVPLGPLAVTSQRPAKGRYALDITTHPDGTQHLELAQKVAADRALRTRQQLESMLASAGVQVCSDQSGQAGAKLENLLPRKP